jgi:hypothetical protein
VSQPSPDTVKARGRGWVALAAALAVVPVVAVAVVGPSLLDDGGSPGPDVATQPAPVAPAGQRAVSWHGVQVFVPATWTLEDLHCHQAQSDTVVRPGARDDCLMPYVTGLTVVEFRAGAETVPGAREVEVSGHRGSRGTVPLTEEDGVRAVLVLLDLDVTVSVRSPDEAAAQAILDTIAVVDVDALGCASRLPDTAPPPPEVPGAADRVLPGEPARVVLCEYGDLQLERSGILPPDQVQALQAALDAARAGSSPSRSGTEVSPDLCPEYDRAPLVVQAEYADGSSLQVFTRLNSCTGPDPDNGARQVVVDAEAIFPLYAAVRR